MYDDKSFDNNHDDSENLDINRKDDSNNQHNEYEVQNDKVVNDNSSFTLNNNSEKNDTSQQANNNSNSYYNPYNNAYYGGDYGYMKNDPSIRKNKKKKKNKLAITIVSAVLAVALLFTGFVATVIHFINPILDDLELSNKINNNENKNGYKLPIKSVPSTNDDSKNNDGTMEIPQVVESVAPSVVCVIVRTQRGDAEGVGSGVIMTEDGYVFTNAHVVQGGTEFEIVLNDGSYHKAKVVGFDDRTDLAVLKINASGLTSAIFGDSDKVKVGETVIAIGNPYGLEFSNTVTNGIISAIRKDILLNNQRMSLLQTNAQINPGNSGGPLVNMYGQVIGITSLKILSAGGTTSEGLGFAIPINTAKPILEELINKGYVSNRPMVGVSGSYIDEMFAAPFGFPTGIFVQYVDPKSDAAKKGIKVNDIITHVNGKKITSMDQFMTEKENFKVGDSIELTVYSSGQTKNIKIMLMENKPSS